MGQIDFPIRAKTLAEDLGAKLTGDGTVLVHGVSSIENAQAGSLAVLHDRKYKSYLSKIHGVVLITSEEFVDESLPITFLTVKKPQQIFSEIAGQFRRKLPRNGVSPSAKIHPNATLGTNCHIGAFSVIEEGVFVGNGTVIYPDVYVGPFVSIGENCEIHPKVVIADRTVISDGVKIFSGTIIGSDGFGFTENSQENRLSEVPQIGKVIIESDVRIGANCTIDCATVGETRIGQGTKIDNLVHIGHNCNIGKNVVICAQVGLSGSVTIGDWAILAGQVGIGHGVSIGKKVCMGGQSGTSTNLKDNEMYNMTPAIPIRKALRVIKYIRKLPDIWQRLKNVETHLALNQGGEKLDTSNSHCK